MSSSNSNAMRGPRRWPYVIGALGLLLVAVYFIATSSAVLKSVVLPKVAAAVGSDVAVDEISLSPFSSLEIRGLKVVPKGETSLAEIREIRARYSLLSIIQGKIQVEELIVDGLAVTVVEKADGSGNLASLLTGLPKSGAKKGRSPAPQLSVKNVNLKGASLRFDRTDRSGGRTVAEISGLNVGVDQIANGQATKITIGADARADLSGQPQAGRIGGKLGGTVDVTLDANLLPTSAKGGVRIDIADATAALQTYSGLGLALDVDFANQDLKDLAIRFSQKGQELARIGIRGQVDLAKSEVRLTYEVQGLDRKILALAGAASGIDLGETRVGASGRLDLLKGGEQIASSGKLDVRSFSLGGNGTRTPVLDLTTEYRISINKLEQNALLDRLDIRGTQAGRELIKGSLDRSMYVSWDKASAQFRESSFALKLGPLDLSQWRAVLPTNAPTAMVSTDVKVSAEQAGRLLRYTVSTTLDELSASVGSSQVRNAQAAIRLTGTFSDFTAIVVEGYQVDIRLAREQLLALSGVADWNLSTMQGGAQLSLEGQLPSLLGLYPLEGISMRAGGLKASITATQRSTGSSADLSLALSKLTGSIGSIQLTDYEVNFGAAAGIRGPEVDIQRVSLATQSGFNPGGSFMARGKYNLESKAGTVEFNTVGVNESAVGPFLASALAPNRLKSVAIDVQGKADIALAGASSVKTTVRVSNLVVDDPAGRLPKSPLELGVDLDASSDGRVSDVRKLVLDLGATDRASNRLEVLAKVDLGTNKPAPTTLTLRSTGLDFTPLYNLFAGSTNVTSAPDEPTPVASRNGNVEPSPIHLPLQDATLDIDIARIYLRQIDVSGMKGQIKALNDTVTVDGFSFLMNGAPVRAKAKANLAIPGYDYDVDFAADRLPLAPLANSFVPVLNGAAQGELLAALQIKGAGVTGTSLRRNLKGFATIEATNAQIKIPEKSIRLPKLLSTLLLLPRDINPAFLLSAIGKKDVLAEPIRVIELHALMGNGGVVVTNTRIFSPAFLTTVGGDIQIADVLSNSPVNLPVTIAFASGGRMGAQNRIGRVNGTIGATGFEKDLRGMKAVFDGLTIPGVGNLGDLSNQGIKKLGDGINQATGGALNKVGGAVGALTGGGANTNGAASAVGGFLNVLTGGKATNAPATNAPSTNAAPKPFNPLDLLNRGKK